jgi:hypothetical protein
MGQGESTCTAPPLVCRLVFQLGEFLVIHGGGGGDDVGGARLRDVAVQVAFESKGLRPFFHFIGSRSQVV